MVQGSGGAGGRQTILDKDHFRPPRSRILVLCSKNELVNNLGTIAKSRYQGVFGGQECWRSHFHDWAVGGRLLLDLVSDKVRVVSYNFEDEQYIWESAAGVSFTVQNDTEMIH